MEITIKNRWNGNVIFRHEAEENNIRVAIAAAIEAGANLSGANLSRANLSGADLSGANLSRANLSRANLTDADLSGAKIDYSYGWSFRCPHSRFRVGISFAHQALAHLCSLKCDDPEFAEIIGKIKPHALKSHRVGDLGLVDDAHGCSEKTGQGGDDA